MTDYPESFANYPPTLGDARCEKNGTGEDRSVRETLIEVLRSLDKGEIAAGQIFIAYTKISQGFGYWCGGPSPGGMTELIGLIERAKMHMLFGDDDG